MKYRNYLLVNNSKYFNRLWYKRKYKVIGDSVRHYCNIGYKLGYNPSPKFSHIKYELIYDDVRYYKVNPLVHYHDWRSSEDIFTYEDYISKNENKIIIKEKKIQNKRIKKEYCKKTKNLIIFLVPELDTVNGGIMSICSIAKVTKKLKKIHNSETIICTVPSKKTFSNYKNFNCDFNIYRFEQIMKYFSKLENVYIHIPETFVYNFLYSLNPEQQLFLKNIKNLTINILNQNIDLLPRPRYVEYLKGFSSKVTMTCAHKKYCVPQLRTSFDIDVHWLSASNLIKYNYVKYSEKENILLYSPDCHVMKDKILQKIKSEFPYFELIEIKNMKYNDYLNLIGKAKYMITFGEGLDGYFVESIRSGTMAFSCYNSAFFNNSFDKCSNLYLNYNEMYNRIVDDIIAYENNNEKYKNVVDYCFNIDKKEYNDREYIKNIEEYYKGVYTFSLDQIIKKRQKRIEKKPLVSIAVATYNGDKYIRKQIESLLKQDYSNIEIIVSDDNSTDNTYNILNEYKNKIKVYKNSNKGLNNNFINAIQHCKGYYLALCDQDDIWETNKISELVKKIDDFDIINCCVCVIDENDNYHNSAIMHQAYEIDKTYFIDFEKYIKENPLLGCTSLMKMSFVKKFLSIPKACIYHDWWFAMNCIKNGNGIVFVDEQLVKYRQHSKNTAYLTFNSNDWEMKKIEFNKMILKKIKNLSTYEKERLIIDSNYNMIRKSLHEYMPCYLDNYLNNNYKFITNEFIKNFKDVIDKYIDNNNIK